MTEFCGWLFSLNSDFSDFGLSYAKNGELLKYIRKIGSFDETCTRFYSAEIVSALEYLHNVGIIHRYVLKPSHVSLPFSLHRSSDRCVSFQRSETREYSFERRNAYPDNRFWDSKTVVIGQQARYISVRPAGRLRIIHSVCFKCSHACFAARANSFVGTAQYVSPELLTEKSACKR